MTTLRTSGISTPMPNATVATNTRRWVVSEKFLRIRRWSSGCVSPWYPEDEYLLRVWLQARRHRHPARLLAILLFQQQCLCPWIEWNYVCILRWCNVPHMTKRTGSNKRGGPFKKEKITHGSRKGKGHTLQLINPGWMRHMCVGNLTIIGWDNGLSPDRCQVIIWTNAMILLIWTLGTKYSVHF